MINGEGLARPARFKPLAFALMCAFGVAHAQQGSNAAAPPARFDVNEYLVRGNHLLDAVEIEQTVEPYLGPGRSLDDVQDRKSVV